MSLLTQPAPLPGRGPGAGAPQPQTEPGHHPAESHSAAVRAHRAALKAYCYMLVAALDAGEAEARGSAATGGGGASGPSAAAAGAERGGGRGRKPPKASSSASSSASSAWDWEGERDKLLRPLAAACELDLAALHQGREVDPGLLDALGKAAAAPLRAAAAAAAAARSKSGRASAGRMAGLLASRHGRGQALAAAAVDALHRGEHAAGALLDLLAAAAEAEEGPLGGSQPSGGGGGKAGLASEVVRAICRVPAAEYARQQRADGVGLRTVAAFLADLSERMPLALAANLPGLMAHLEGEAYSLRCAVVSVMGRLVVKTCGTAG